VCEIETELDAISLLEALKGYEREYGRDPSAPRWSNRTIDLDIIDYDRQVISRQRLHVPHPEYQTRLFVLVPLQEILPGWRDVRTGNRWMRCIANSPKIEVLKTSLKW
jgi:2-amino-4-hydroxy-6-hydroxymethyldihydropteridine diphosphokinase